MLGIHPQVGSPLNVILDEKFAELALKYSPQIVVNAWNEVTMANGDEADSSCKCKPEITVSEALGFLDDYFDFVETMIQKRQEMGKTPVFFQ